MKKKDKLNLPKWRLWLKRIKYWMFTHQPIPLLQRRKCDHCKIVWHPRLFTGCPLCGRGEKRVFVVLWNNTIQGIYHDPDDAKWAKNHIDAESDRESKIEDWDVQ